MSVQIHELVEDSKDFVRSLFPDGNYEVNVEMCRHNFGDECFMVLCVERGLAKFVKEYSIDIRSNIHNQIGEIGPRFAQEAMRVKFNNTGGLR